MFMTLGSSNLLSKIFISWLSAYDSEKKYNYGAAVALEVCAEAAPSPAALKDYKAESVR